MGSAGFEGIPRTAAEDSEGPRLLERALGRVTLQTRLRSGVRPRISDRRSIAIEKALGEETLDGKLRALSSNGAWEANWPESLVVKLFGDETDFRMLERVQEWRDSVGGRGPLSHGRMFAVMKALREEEPQRRLEALTGDSGWNREHARELFEHLNFDTWTRSGGVDDKPLEEVWKNADLPRERWMADVTRRAGLRAAREGGSQPLLERALGRVTLQTRLRSGVRPRISDRRSIAIEKALGEETLDGKLRALSSNGAWEANWPESLVVKLFGDETDFRMLERVQEWRDSVGGRGPLSHGRMFAVMKALREEEPQRRLEALTGDSGWNREHARELFEHLNFDTWTRSGGVDDKPLEEVWKNADLPRERWMADVTRRAEQNENRRRQERHQAEQRREVRIREANNREAYLEERVRMFCGYQSAMSPSCSIAKGNLLDYSVNRKMGADLAEFCSKYDCSESSSGAPSSSPSTTGFIFY